jgi:hypothetical protein
LAGASVTIDGKKKITIKTGEGKEPIEIVADEKMHRLRVTKGGFEAFVKEFKVNAGGFLFRLCRTQPAPIVVNGN